MILRKFIKYLSILIEKFRRIKFYFSVLIRKEFYGFIKGNDYLTEHHRKMMYSLILNPDQYWQSRYEEKLAGTLGKGKVLTYASGRMAFYSILKALNIQQNDEVILTGFTCSVMVNAVKRLGATVIFSDVDPETFGSCPVEISKLISSKTKVIVAQHSFGCPCKIDKIQELAKTHNIFLIEDCALSFLSKYKDIILGNWGDAAIFSSDHTKPMSTLIGGFAYTRNDELYENLRSGHKSIGEIPHLQQLNIYNQIIFESKYYKPDKYRFLLFYQVIRKLLNIFSKRSNIPTFLVNDSDSVPSNDFSYPYPAQFPSFLSYLGCLELEEFKESIEHRRLLLNQLLEVISTKYYISKCYRDVDNYIIPLRFAFCSDSDDLHKKIGKIFDKEWFWFKKPIEATSEELIAYGYVWGSCPNSEHIGKNIVNIPCIFFKDEKMIEYLKNTI